MIHDVDESLRALVRRDVLNGSGVDMAFDAPSRDWASRRNGPALNFYLYDITEDLTRREVNAQDVRNEAGHVIARRQPPRRFRLSYLVTAWANRPEDEHRLLAAVLGCFLRSDTLPPDLLAGSLAGEPSVRTTIGLPLPKDRQLSDVWSAFGGELKAALDLAVYAPFVTGRGLEAGPPVLEPTVLRARGLAGAVEEVSRKGAAAAGTGGPGR